jgi:uncharacterized protein YfcZ (UPF0381/DUF406 family)
MENGGITLSLAEEHAREAEEFLKSYTQYAVAIESPALRWYHLKAMEEAAAKLRGLGVEEPAPQEF